MSFFFNKELCECLFQGNNECHPRVCVNWKKLLMQSPPSYLYITNNKDSMLLLCFFIVELAFVYGDQDNNQDTKVRQWDQQKLPFI